nr:hypothetical protein Iba_scaffold25201CG0050 [Ipomoea batatas]
MAALYHEVSKPYTLPLAPQSILHSTSQAAKDFLFPGMTYSPCKGNRESLFCCLVKLSIPRNNVPGNDLFPLQGE